MDFEEIVMGLIAFAGNARTLSMEAIKEASKNNFQKSEELLVKAGEEFLEAHKIQTDLIQKEAGGKAIPVSLLMVHAQDHLMNALTVKDLAEEIIKLYKNKKGE